MGRVKKRDLPAWMERHQIGLYLAAIALGGGAGFLAPGSAGALEESIYPVLGLLLYATFLGIPFASIGKAARDLRFLATVLVLNFVLVPAVVFGLTRFIAGDQALLVGVLLVLLTPCIDYVIVFTGLAGGASDRLLAAAPVLMLAQMLLLPVYLVVLVGPELVSAIDPAPFVEALVILIIVPLAAAALTQALARRVSLGQVVMAVMQALMVPLMMATLAVVVGSQIVGVGQELGTLVTVVPIYAVFLLVMIPLGLLTAKAAGLDVSATRAVVFSGATRNSLVVLPLALALPGPLSLAALVVVTQTLIELIGMVLYVRFLPLIVRTEPSPRLIGVRGGSVRKFTLSGHAASPAGCQKSSAQPEERC
jgi:ACR3 family arsenite transporter